MNYDVSESIVIIGFGQMGQVKVILFFFFPCIEKVVLSGLVSYSVDMILQVLANFLSTPLVSGVDSDLVGWPYIGFDLNPAVVKVCK